MAFHRPRDYLHIGSGNRSQQLHLSPSNIQNLNKKMRLACYVCDLVFSIIINCQFCKHVGLWTSDKLQGGWDVLKGLADVTGGFWKLYLLSSSCLPFYTRLQYFYLKNPANHTVVLFSWQGTLLTHIQLATNPNPQISFCGAALQPPVPQSRCKTRIAPAQVQNPALWRYLFSFQAVKGVYNWLVQT